TESDKIKILIGKIESDSKRITGIRSTKAYSIVAGDGIRISTHLSIFDVSRGSDRILKGVVLNFLDSLKQSDRLQSVPFVHRTSLFSDLVTRNARADSFHVNHLICSVRHLSGNAISDLTYGIPVLKRKFPASIIDTTGILYRLTLTKRRRKWQLKKDILC